MNKSTQYPQGGVLHTMQGDIEIAQGKRKEPSVISVSPAQKEKSAEMQGVQTIKRAPENKKAGESDVKKPPEMITFAKDGPKPKKQPTKQERIEKKPETIRLPETKTTTQNIAKPEEKTKKITQQPLARQDIKTPLSSNAAPSKTAPKTPLVALTPARVPTPPPIKINDEAKERVRVATPEIKNAAKNLLTEEYLDKILPLVSAPKFVPKIDKKDPVELLSKDKKSQYYIEPQENSWAALPSPETKKAPKLEQKKQEVEKPQPPNTINANLNEQKQPELKRQASFLTQNEETAPQTRQEYTQQTGQKLEQPAPAPPNSPQPIINVSPRSELAPKPQKQSRTSQNLETSADYAQKETYQAPAIIEQQPDITSPAAAIRQPQNPYPLPQSAPPIQKQPEIPVRRYQENIQNSRPPISPLQMAKQNEAPPSPPPIMNDIAPRGVLTTPEGMPSNLPVGGPPDTPINYPIPKIQPNVPTNYPSLEIQPQAQPEPKKPEIPKNITPQNMPQAETFILNQPNQLERLRPLYDPFQKVDDPNPRLQEKRSIYAFSDSSQPSYDFALGKIENAKEETPERLLGLDAPPPPQPPPNETPENSEEKDEKKNNKKVILLTGLIVIFIVIALSAAYMFLFTGNVSNKDRPPATTSEKEQEGEENENQENENEDEEEQEQKDESGEKIDENEQEEEDENKPSIVKPAIPAIVPPSPWIRIPNMETRQIEVDQPTKANLEEALKDLASQDLAPGSITYIPIRLTALTEDGSPQFLTADKLLSGLGVDTPTNFINSVEAAFMLFAYSPTKEDSIICGEASSVSETCPGTRLGLVFKGRNANENPQLLPKLLGEWIRTDVTTLKPLVLDNAVFPENPSFKSVSYEGVESPISYINLPHSATTVNLAIFDEYLVIATSKNSAIAMLSEMAQLKNK